MPATTDPRPKRRRPRAKHPTIVRTLCYYAGSESTTNARVFNYQSECGRANAKVAHTTELTAAPVFVIVEAHYAN